ncbi:MAG: molybdopterin-dependent oxidoreductase [Lachnospiraceae bacterium]|nr:molybdopterin-dependent oxidoreductase [Lachnospiraceae bacterium]
MTYTQKTICPYDCPAACGLLAETDGTRLVTVQGDKDHPMTKGLICRKMQNYEKSVNSVNRILTPLKRVGEKGEGRFVPVTWEEAVEEIAGRFQEILKEDGGNAILPVYFSGVMSVIQRRCGDAFFNRLGARQLVKSLCSSAKGAGYKSVMGDTGCLDPRELKDSDFILIWGSNVKSTRIHTMPVLAQARKEGKRVVLVEACALDMADTCDQVVLLKPGTDGALALAMMHVLAKEGMTDEEYLKKHARGYELFKKTLVTYTPEWAGEITGVPAETIRELAREYGKASAPAILMGSGPSRQGNGGMNVRLVVILSAITGAWGKPGGGFCGSNPGAGPYVAEERVTRPDFRKKEWEDEAGEPVNINQLGQALCCEEKGKRIRALYVYGSNPALTVSDQSAVLKGLARSDLFTVVHERFITDTARYADFVLPATFSVEQTDCYTAYGYCTFGTAYQVVKPAGQCKSNWDTFRLLARAMGYEEEYFDRTEEEVLWDLLEHPDKGLLNISEEEWQLLEKGGVITTPFADHGRFLTEDGRIQIVNESLADPLPCYRENHGGQEPLCLVAVPSFYTLNSTFLDREDLTGRRGEARIFLHPADGAARGIKEGDLVEVFNDLAQVCFRAGISDRVAKGVAAVPGVFRQDADGRALHVNALHHERLSDMADATTLNDNRVEIRLAARYCDSL